MDVEGPGSPIRSVRDFAIHIATVTIGILIALALEALIGMYRDRTLVVHAETDFRTEFSANRATIVDDLRDSQAVKTELEGLINYGQAEISGQAAVLPNLQTVRKFTHLQATAWETATATQALLHIPFSKAGVLSKTQRAQQSFNALQDQAEVQWFELAAYGDPRHIPKSQLPAALQKVTIAYAYLVSIRDAETRLISSYDVALRAL